jgi:hypothetical protein
VTLLAGVFGFIAGALTGAGLDLLGIRAQDTGRNPAMESRRRSADIRGHDSAGVRRQR